MDIAAFRAALGDIPVEDNPRIVQQKSRDHYWYSPRLKQQLENVTAQLVVSPRSVDAPTLQAVSLREAVRGAVVHLSRKLPAGPRAPVPHTVETHLQRAYEKLGVRGRAELADALSGASL